MARLWIFLAQKPSRLWTGEGLKWNGRTASESAKNRPQGPEEDIQAKGMPSKDGSDPILIFDIPDDCYEYPPIPVRFSSRRSEILWLLDLLDQLAGELAYGN